MFVRTLDFLIGSMNSTNCSGSLPGGDEGGLAGRAQQSLCFFRRRSPIDSLRQRQVSGVAHLVRWHAARRIEGAGDSGRIGQARADGTGRRFRIAIQSLSEFLRDEIDYRKGAANSACQEKSQSLCRKEDHQMNTGYQELCSALEPFPCG